MDTGWKAWATFAQVPQIPVICDPDFGLLPGELRLIGIGPVWVQCFSEKGVRIAEALGAAALAIEHIGSTAIPGVSAKPILDIAVASDRFESGHSLAPCPAALGYDYHGENAIHRKYFRCR